MDSWILHIDRALWPTWCSLHAPLALSIAGEIGENFQLVHCAQPIGASTLLASGFARASLPVHASFPRASWLAAESASWAQLRALCEHARAARLIAIPVRRHGERAARALEDWAKSALPQLARDADAPEVLVAVSDRESYVGISSRRLGGSPYPLGLMPRPLDEAVDRTSRARFKLRESLAWLKTHGYASKNHGMWLDLGAFPGGMTRELVDAGHRVLAVDLAAPPALLLGLEPVTYRRADALNLALDAIPLLDGLVCDMNGTPARAAAAVARLIPCLRDGGVVVHTIKFATLEGAPAVVERTRHIFEQAGLACLAVRHQCYNRRELTYLGIKRA